MCDGCRMGSVHLSGTVIVRLLSCVFGCPVVVIFLHCHLSSRHVLGCSENDLFSKGEWKRIRFEVG